jgi:hypothetical protein
MWRTAQVSYRPAMARRALLVAVVVALAGAAPASASERGIAVGQQVFGALACGTPTVERATFLDPAVLAGADPGTCRILLNRLWAGELPRAMRCTLILHEYGHLAGRPHSADPDSVMHHDYVRDDPRCSGVTFSAPSRSAPASRTGTSP